MSGNRIYVQGSYIDVHDNENVYLSVDKAEVNMGNKKKKEHSSLSKETLEKTVLKVQRYFWGASSYAVIFCVCRDKYGYADNMSMFERELMNMESLNESDYPCKQETITSTMKNNTYMKKPIDNWEANGAKERVLKLRDEFIKAMEQTEQI